MGSALQVSREVITETLAFVGAALTTVSKWTANKVDDQFAAVVTAIASNEMLVNLIYMLLGYAEAKDSQPAPLPGIEEDADGVLQLVAAPLSEDGTLALIQASELDNRIDSLLTPQHVEALNAAGIGAGLFKAMLPLIIELLRKRLAGGK